MFKSVFPPPRTVTITLKARPQVEEGTIVAAAVLDRAGGETCTTARKHDGRGLYRHGRLLRMPMEIDGVPNQQSCLIPCGKACR
ncbi:MAG: 2Fe-2S iron-sulfur cluster-binding protein [Bilophila wadsworthia]